MTTSAVEPASQDPRFSLLAARAEAALGAPQPALTALLGRLPWPVRWSASQESARRALAIWLDGPDARRAVLFGPAGAGKTLLGAVLAAEAEGSSRTSMLVPIGRAQGLGVEARVLALLAALLRESEGEPLPNEITHPRRSVVRRIAGGREEDESSWLVVLDGLDELVGAPDEARFDAVEEIGERTHVLVSVTGGRANAERWCARLGWRVDETTLIGIDGFSIADAKRLGVASEASWAARDEGADRCVEAIGTALQGRSEGAAVERALGVLTRLLGPIDAGELETIAGYETAILAADRDLLLPIVRFIPRDGQTDLAFAHEALRAAWERRSAADEARIQSRILECARASMATAGEASGYMRAYASAHLVLAGASVEDLARFADPAWASATSASRAADILADLGRTRTALNHAWEQAISRGGASRRAGDALGAILRCALAKASTTVRVEQARWAPSPLLADHVDRATFEVASMAALHALSRCASSTLRESLFVDAIERATTVTSSWQLSGSVLRARYIAIARDAAARGRLEIARAALESMDCSGEEGQPRTREDSWGESFVALASMLPPEEGRARIPEAVTRIRRGSEPRATLAALAPDDGLEPHGALALLHAVQEVEPNERILLLARLVPWLPARERSATIQEILAGWKQAIGDPEASVPMEPTLCDELTPWLSEPEVRGLLEDVPIWPVDALAARLSGFGHVEEAQALVERWCETPLYRAPALLRVAASAPAQAQAALSKDLKALIAALTGNQRARLIADQPNAAVQILGPEAALAAAAAGVERGAHGALVAIAAVTPYLPEASRSAATRQAITLHREDPDSDAVDRVVTMAPWMMPEDAAWLVAASLGEIGSTDTVEGVLGGWGSVAQLAPLIARAGGDAALRAAADEATRAARLWARE